MTSEGLTRGIARYIVGASIEDIPSSVYEHAKVALMDWFAVTMAGKDEPLVHNLLRYTEVLGGKEQATVLGHDVKKNVSQAALINGAASHALDYDDTLKVFMGHPSVTLFPGILALAEWQEKSGVDFLQAYLIGFEVGARIGACAGTEHYLAGWHATSTIGRMASAAACSKLMGLDEQQTLYALGIAGTQTGGLKRVFGTMCKPFHVGAASQGGLTAAMLAAGGFNSAEDILEGANGFFQAFRGAPDPEKVASLGKIWEIEGLDQKYHASCHFTHSPIEAVLDAADANHLACSDIKSVRVEVSALAVDTAGIPEPTTGLEGKFSLRYCVANALQRRVTGLAAFTKDKVNDPEIKGFMEKVSIVVTDDIQDMSWAARAKIESHSGEVYESEVDVGTKIYGLEVKKEKIGAKFADLCIPVLGSERTKDLAELLSSMDKLDNVRGFVSRVQ